MKKIFCITILLLAVTISGFTQQHEIKIPYNDISVTKEIKFEPFRGEGDAVMVDIEFKKDALNNAIVMTFKSSPRYGGKYMYFFGGNHNMKLLKKEDPNIWFDKKIKKAGKKKVVKYYDISTKETIQCFDMSSKNDFTITFSQDKKELELYAYIAIRESLSGREDDKRNRRILYLAKESFKIFVEEKPVVDMCKNNIVEAQIQKFREDDEKLKIEIEKIKDTTDILKNISCEKFKEYKRKKALTSKAETSEGKYLYANCSDCDNCSIFKNVKDNLYITIEAYNNAVVAYTKLLKQKEGEYRDPCSASGCNCDCSKLSEVSSKVRNLLFALQSGVKKKDEAVKELKTLQSSLHCTGDCTGKDCESLCHKCSAYTDYKRDCDAIKNYR